MAERKEEAMTGPAPEILVRDAAIEECIAKVIEIGRDWRADGQMLKWYAVEYLAANLRDMKRRAPAAGLGEKVVAIASLYPRKCSF